MRGTGGRAAAYHEQTVVLEIVSPDDEGPAGSKPRFSGSPAISLQMLLDLGVDELRQAWFPASTAPAMGLKTARAGVKLAGTAGDGAGVDDLGAELVVTNADPIRAGAYDADAALELDFATAASVTDLRPSTSTRN